jgi:hypothetical protein
MNHTPAARLIVSHNREQEEAALKARFLQRLATATAALREVVARLYAIGITRDQLIQWAVAAGHHQGYVRSLLSRLFCNTGHRRRKPGAGRKTPPEALALLAYASDRYGDRAPRFLLAAYRAAKAQTALQRAA